jgi:hypothetical protein
MAVGAPEVEVVADSMVEAVVASMAAEAFVVALEAEAIEAESAVIAGVMAAGDGAMDTAAEADGDGDLASG